MIEYNKETQYKCDICGGIYDKKDEKALTECREEFKNWSENELATICNVCLSEYL